MSTHLTIAAGFALAVVAVVPGCSAPANEPPHSIKYYIQLIRGNDSDKSPMPGSKPVGPKLGRKLLSVFNWTNYWEVNRQEAKVVPGHKTKVRLSNEREVEIDLAEAGKRKVTAFQDGKPLGSTSCPLGEAMTVIGGDRDANSVWFIVVRRDMPPD